MNRALLIASFLGSITCSALTAAELWWNPHYKCRRKVAVKVGKKLYPGKEACYVKFWTAGRIQEKGEDIRVIARKDEVHYKIIFLGPGDRCELVFEAQDNVSEYEIYYDNPDAKQPDYRYEPKRGLLLETRRYRGGGFQTWPQMQTALKQSGGFVLGRDYVPNVFLGYNPFGPSENFISIFDGWLAIPSAGEYYFATTSDDASFLLIDNKMVVEWPGVHSAVPYAAQFNHVTLTQGLHAFTYYHVQAIDKAIAVAAWLPPWLRVGSGEPRTPDQRREWLKTQKFQVIPEGSFPPVLKGELTGYEIRGERIAPDFDAHNVGEVLLDDKYLLVRMQFENRTRAVPGTRILNYYWDFGDGNVGQGDKVEHIYLTTGDHQVKLGAGTAARQYSVTQRVRVENDWSRQINPSTDTAEDYARVISNYNFDDMPSEALMVAARLFHLLQKPAEATKLCEQIIFKVKEASPAALFEAVKVLDDMCRKPGGSPELTVRACEGIEPKLKGMDEKAQVALIAGDVCVNLLNKPEEAMKHFQRVISEYGSADRQTIRKALVGLGDAYRMKAARGGKEAEGQAERAKEMYMKAEALPVSQEPYAKAAVRIGALSRAVEMYIRTGELDNAEDFLRTWEWEFPTERMSGRSTLLKARILMARENYGVAAQELERLVIVNPRNAYAAEALMTAADCYLKLGEGQKAVNALTTLTQDYLDSPLVENARKKLEEISSKQ